MGIEILMCLTDKLSHMKMEIINNQIAAMVGILYCFKWNFQKLKLVKYSYELFKQYYVNKKVLIVVNGTLTFY